MATATKSFHAEGVLMQGKLSNGRQWVIKPSRKRSPGLEEGRHLILVLVDDQSGIHEVSREEFRELSAIVHDYAMMNTAPNYNFRIAYNGPGVGSRAHIHFHIMIPEGSDKLPFLVARTSEGGDSSNK